MAARRGWRMLGVVLRYVCFQLSSALLVLACSGGGAPTPQAPESGTAARSAAPQGKHAPCTLGSDQLCNDDPAVSALWGRCTELGVCECKPGFELSPISGHCRPVP